jgi:N-acyl-L-homoserine lactone synthetase
VTAAAPELVNDAATLEAIYRLRAQVWRETGTVSPAAFGSGGWSDEHDDAAMHWVIRGDTGELLAAARLSIHERLADVPESAAYAAAGLDLAGRIGAPAHLVVATAARGHGLFLQLADTQKAAARAAGCTFLVCQASPAMRRLLLRRGWEETCPGPADDRFPGVGFVVMVLELASAPDLPPTPSVRRVS